MLHQICKFGESECNPYSVIVLTSLSSTNNVFKRAWKYPTIWSICNTIRVNATYLGKLIIHIVLLQPPNTMYLPDIEVPDDIVSLCGDGPAWKCPNAELLHHTAFQNKFMRMQSL